MFRIMFKTKSSETIVYEPSNYGRQEYEKKQKTSSMILEPTIVCFGLAGFPKGLQYGARPGGAALAVLNPLVI